MCLSKHSVDSSVRKGKNMVVTVILLRIPTEEIFFETLYPQKRRGK